MSNHLEERVNAFMLMELPGQSQMMHMGTARLVNDLWREVKNLREAKIDLKQERDDWKRRCRELYDILDAAAYEFSDLTPEAAKWFEEDSE